MQRFDAISIFILLMLSGCAALPDAEKPVPPVAPEKRITEFPKEIVPHEASIPHTRSTEEQQELNPQNKSKKYPPLIYGSPKPLICSHPYLAEKN